MQNINTQYESVEWSNFKKNYFFEHENLICDTCEKYSDLDIYLREKHIHIKLIWNYPKSAFGIICKNCAIKRNEKIYEVMNTINFLSSTSLDALLDTFDLVKLFSNQQEITLEQLFASAKQIRR
jgi:hypothetical protein